LISPDEFPSVLVNQLILNQLLRETGEPKVNGSSVGSAVTVRNLRELEIYSSPLVSKFYSPEICSQLTAQEPSND